jgi:uncharacterized pyridoxamine 5'-phosphate oxidase family protein
MTIDYETLREEVLRFLDEHKVLFLATSADDRVTARAMSCVHVGLEIYFQTSNKSVKFTQLVKNPKVALCAANIAIEGVATIGKHTMDPENEQFVELYKASLGCLQCVFSPGGQCRHPRRSDAGHILEV